MVKVACVLLTFNEEADIEQCLKQFRVHIDYILVLDGGSKDTTAELARRVADAVVVKPFSGSFADEKNHAWSLLPKDIDWILWPDPDEKWDHDFLINIKKKVEEAEKARVVCFRFPRVNLPDCKNWPDYQLRFVKNSKDFEWRGKLDEVLWWKPQNIPLDQADKADREIKLGIGEADEHPIIHLKRITHKQREWWMK